MRVHGSDDIRAGRGNLSGTAAEPIADRDHDVEEEQGADHCRDPEAGCWLRQRARPRHGPRAAIACRPGSRADRPAGEQVALDLQADPVEDLPLVGVDLEGCQLLVDQRELGRRVRGVVGELLEAPLDPLGFGRGGAVDRRRGEPAGDRGAGAGDLRLAARDRNVRLVDEDLDARDP